MTENEEMAVAGPPREQRTKTFPLNSRRLTASVISRIARELGLQIAASLEDTRQVVGGKLEEMGNARKTYVSAYTKWREVSLSPFVTRKG